MLCLRIIHLTFIALILVSCGHSPSSSEKAAKTATLTDVKALEKKLRTLIPDLVLQKYPGTQKDYLRFRGNYIGRQSKAEAHYVTNLSGNEACKQFLNYFRGEPGWDTKSMRGECDVKRIHKFLFSSIDARKPNLTNKNEAFSISIGIKDFKGSSVVENLKGRSKIEINISRTLNWKKSASCTPRPSGKSPCRNAAWYEWTESNN